MKPNFNEKLSPADRQTSSILLTNRAEQVSYRIIMKRWPPQSDYAWKTGFTGFFHISLTKA
jgi:hypothetical protein